MQNEDFLCLLNGYNKRNLTEKLHTLAKVLVERGKLDDLLFRYKPVGISPEGYLIDMMALYRESYGITEDKTPDIESLEHDIAETIFSADDARMHTRTLEIPGGGRVRIAEELIQDAQFDIIRQTIEHAGRQVARAREEALFDQITAGLGVPRDMIMPERNVLLQPFTGEPRMMDAEAVERIRGIMNRLADDTTVRFL